MRGLALHREPLYSPGRIADDHKILSSVAQKLVNRGHTIMELLPGQPLPAFSGNYDFILTMSQSLARLEETESWLPTGALCINSTNSIRSSSRRGALIQRLAEHSIPTPPTWRVESSAEFRTDVPVWLKSSGAHRVRHDDVQLVQPSHIEKALATRHRRGEQDVIVQVHTPGRILKCYAVGDRVLFPPGLPDDWTTLVLAAGLALGLTAFGVDLVVRRSQALVIDVNDWPSFSVCFDEASSTIADFVDPLKSAYQRNFSDC